MDRQDAKAAKGREPTERLDDLARRVIGAGIEVHRHLGPGFSESVYEEALCVELGFREIPFERQVPIEVLYKGRRVGMGQIDLLVGRSLVVELKAVATLTEVHRAQVISYLKAIDAHLGLLLNFKEAKLSRGVRRVVWSHSGSDADEKASEMQETHEAPKRLLVPSCDSSVALQPVEEDFDAIA